MHALENYPDLIKYASVGALNANEEFRQASEALLAEEMRIEAAVQMNKLYKNESQRKVASHQAKQLDQEYLEAKRQCNEKRMCRELAEIDKETLLREFAVAKITYRV